MHLLIVRNAAYMLKSRIIILGENVWINCLLKLGHCIEEVTMKKIKVYNNFSRSQSSTSVF